MVRWGASNVSPFDDIASSGSFGQARSSASRAADPEAAPDGDDDPGASDSMLKFPVRGSGRTTSFGRSASKDAKDVGADSKDTSGYGAYMRETVSSGGAPTAPVTTTGSFTSRMMLPRRHSEIGGDDGPMSALGQRQTAPRASGLGLWHVDHSRSNSSQGQAAFAKRGSIFSSMSEAMSGGQSVPVGGIKGSRNSAPGAGVRISASHGSSRFSHFVQRFSRSRSADGASSRFSEVTRQSVQTKFTEQTKRSMSSIHHIVQNARKKRSDPIMVVIARWIVSNKVFIALTTLLTVYALIGDDIRVMATNKPADVWFNVCTLTCLVIFTFEIVMSCLGQNDYIFGFFMWLDVVSTITLILDLTYVSDIVMGDGEDLDKMRSGRTARVGAKAGRVVRVIRLVRILKLYKTFYAAAGKKRDKLLGLEDDDDWDDVADEDHSKHGTRESRVGKKLGEMTTRRVIILVLTMLIVLPFLRTQSSDNVPPAPYYGADEIYEAWVEKEQRPTWSEGQIRYERAVLKYLYYHNWFTGRSGTCPSSDLCSNWYNAHVFWIGIVSKGESQIQQKVNSTRLRLSTVQDWNKEAMTQKDIYNYGTMPNEALIAIGGDWQACNDASKGIFRRGFSLLGTQIESQVDYIVPCPSDLRNMEKSKFYARLRTSQKHREWHFAFYFDTRPLTRAEGMFGLIITSFICVVLCIASLYFSSDANRLVLQPVEHMIKRVESIRDNPLIAMRMADEEHKQEEKKRAKQMRRQATMAVSWQAKFKEPFHCCQAEARQEPMETVVLEKTIIKLGSLLALGFGEAGASIIGQNLAQSDSAGVNVMIPGTKVECIIGKARINDFSTATEVLQGKVMTFVNQIAEIVHGVVDEFRGAANKNNGDTFLLIWRTSGLDEAMSSKYADMSMMAFAKILGAVHRAPVLAAYRMHPGLQQRLGATWEVSLSFGLHAGWAIEGAVGSEFKIDASYLSPNVSIASSVEAATKVYNVPILVSQSVVELGSISMGAKCRLIDRVILTGSALPMGLYSLDLDHECLDVQASWNNRKPWNSRQRFRARQWLEVEKNRIMQSDIAEEFESNREIYQMRQRYTKEFRELFHMGFENYTHGEWEVARRLLTDAQQLLPGVEDGPSTALLAFMEKSKSYAGHYEAPEGWTGIRDTVGEAVTYIPAKKGEPGSPRRGSCVLIHDIPSPRQRRHST